MATTFTAGTNIASAEVNANFLEKKARTYTTTATAAGTTTLALASNQIQFFTGVTTQTVTLPVASTMALGYGFEIFNISTGVVTVNSSGANLVQSMAAGSKLEVICILASGTTAASWQVVYKPNFATGVHMPTLSEVAVSAGNGHGSTATRIRRFTTTNTNTGTDITYADSATNGGSFTINTAGIYMATYTDNRTATGPTQMGISGNASSLTTDVQSLAYPEVLVAITTAAIGYPGSVSVTFTAAVNAVIRAHTAGGADETVGSKSNFRIVRIA